jgi:hypothetical protein
MTSYEIIYNKFLQRVVDYKILQMEDEDVKMMLNGWLTSAIANFRTCASDLSKRDDTLEQFEDDLTDLEIEILSILMVSEWLAPQLNSTLLTRQLITGKDEKFYSQSAHLKELMDLQAASDKKARLLLNRYRLINNTYLDEE